MRRLFYRHLTLQGYFLWKNRFLSIFVHYQLCDEITTPPPFPPSIRGWVTALMRFNSSQGIIRGNIIPSRPLYLPEREKKIFLKQILFVVMNLDAKFWFYTVFNFDSLWVNFVKWLGLPKTLFRHKISSVLNSENCSIKKYFVQENIQRINYLIISLFLQKLYTYKWNPNRASQKLSAAVTKLCAVTKLGDLTVSI